MKNTESTALNYDITLLFSVLFLVGIGIVMVYSASSALALKNFSSDYYFLKRQAFFSLMGMIALVVCGHIPLSVYRSLAYPLLATALILLLLVPFSNLGVTAGGAKRWLSIMSFSFQPAEIARLAMVIYLAYSMSKKQENIKDFSIGFLPHLIVLSLFTGLILLQPDFGSVVILATITWILLFVGGVRLRYLLSFVLLILPIVYYVLVNADYRLRRITSFLDPWQYPTEDGYQIIHSLMAFGTGGVWGTGIGKGYQKLFYLPEPHTDFIFSVIGEELGLVGILIIIALYALILWRGISIARNAGDAFSVFMATGITAAILLQVCVNMCVTLGLVPTKGLTLPFLSYGGTSLLVNMASIGILMNIGARHAAK
jgi:cell division protein FtsW